MSAILAVLANPGGDSAPVTPSVVVSGAGTAAVDGTYTERGTADGKPYYNLVGQPDSISVNVVTWVGGDGWYMYDGSGIDVYFSGDDVAFPWLATWTVLNGDSPAPTLTEG